MENKYRRVKLACYVSSISMSVIGNLSPVLFLTFRDLYGISYSLLGLLVLINFVTQLTIDLIFTFFSHKFNIPLAVKMTPVLAFAGLVLFAVTPWLLPGSEYTGMVIGTIIFSAAGGFGEVLGSPVIAAIPARDPDREMSKLHSIYAWGVVFVILFATLFLMVCGRENWQWLTLIFTLVPLVSFCLYLGAEIPPMETPEKVSGALAYLKNKVLWISVLGIFLGGSAECTMAQWSSGYLEQALGIPKVWGDMFGVAMFGLRLGLGRTLYSKYGKRIGHVLFLCAIGSTLCYLTAALTPIPVIGLAACALTGFCTSMLWPGSLIASTDRIPGSGVFLYAMMAAGGDLGASVGPQLVGIITDAVIANPAAAAFAQDLSMAPEQLGMKAGMLVGMLFPLAAIPVFWHIRKGYPKEKAAKEL
ncbi:MAG: MFS transporter [Clostridia bacterium]|nr:MFS transporter [Clostridia bacterium]